MVEPDLLEKQLHTPVLGHKISNHCNHARGDVVQHHRPGLDDPGDDAGEAATGGEVELGGLINAGANHIGDCSGHSGVLREEVT